MLQEGQVRGHFSPTAELPNVLAVECRPNELYEESNGRWFWFLLPLICSNKVSYAEHTFQTSTPLLKKDLIKQTLSSCLVHQYSFTACAIRTHELGWRRSNTS